MNSYLLSRTLAFYAFLFVLSVYVIPEVDGFSHGTTKFRLKRQNRPSTKKKCNGFKCSSTKECIPEEQRCDGKVDCKDGSDEFSDCKKIKCPEYLFTCDYGACIDGEKKCDGKKDCRDNSDETNCIDLTKAQESVSSNCKSDQFECKSGQCISSDTKCDGTFDCEDKSDEIKETCLNIQCPGYTFKCDYGACVNGYDRCDGVKQCVDNSDEENCPTSAPKPTTPPTPKPTAPSTEGCILPNHPNFGKWVLPGGDSFKPGQRTAVNSFLTYSCNNGYKLSRENMILACLSDGWSQAPPTCVKLCPPLYTDDKTKVRCYDQQKLEIKCSEASDGSFVQVECAPYYELTDSRIRFCYQGRWTSPPPQCIPVCGEKTVSAVPLIVNGKNVIRGNYPWVTAIYRIDNNQWINVCGGSMLTQRVILTAAHCVAEESGEPVPKDNVKIAVGKYYNRYMDERDTEAQYSDVDSIEVHDKYRGDNQRYASDIAFIITTETLLFSKVVQPVCSSGLSKMPLKVGMVGVVAGWGYTTAGGNESDELKEVDVPYKDEAQCSKELPPDWYDRYAAAYDKFCAGHYNQSIAVCKGDSGSGLVFKNNNDRFFVQGIVSLAKKINNVGCDIQVSGLYTRVSTHSDWLESIVAQYA